MKTIERLRELLADATQGEWFDDGENVCCDGVTITYDGHPNNTKFIAESRNALPALLAVVEAQAAEIAAWRAADLRHDWIRDNTVGGVPATPEVDTLVCEMNATDAALLALEGGDE